MIDQNSTNPPDAHGDNQPMGGNQPVTAELARPILQTHWGAIQSKRESLVTTIDQMAVSFPQEGSRRLKSLSEWFSQERSFEDALIRADVLGVCLPLCKTLEADGEISQSNLASAARIGFCSVGQGRTGGSVLIKALAYPAVVLLMAVLVAIGLSVYVVPQFEQMFEEFGVALPATTLFFLRMAKLIRKWGWLLILWPTSAVGLVWYLNGVTSRRRPDGIGWLDLWTQGSRAALADWALHISLLLEAGLTQATAMRHAGRYAGKSWLRQNSNFWANDDGDKASSEDDAAPHPSVRKPRYLKSKKFQLLDHALAVPISEGKIELLREVARYYRDRNRSIGLWWVQWLVAFLLWGIGGILLMVILSLFAPLIAIITGLTGGGGAGGGGIF